jgi:hypothetical protein
MNFISWNTKQIINENTQNYLSAELVEENIAKTLKPVMNKMKKLSIGLPYRDARLFFFKFLQDKYPAMVPAGFETRKPSAKDVNALVGQIAMENPELLDKFSAEFDAYSREEVPGGLDRVSQFLNTAATLRQGKGVRQTAAAAAQTGGIKKDYSKLTAQEIADATTDAIKKKEADFDAGDDVSDEKLLLKTAVSSILTKLNDEIHPDVLLNVAEAVSKIETVAKFKEFLDYISELEEYRVIHQYLEDALDVIETNLEDLQAQKEDEEYEQEEAKPDYLDADKDGNKEESMKDALKSADHGHEQEENLVGMEAVLDFNRPVMVIDRDNDGFVFVQDEDGDEFRVSVNRLEFPVGSEDEESNIENTPLEELSILSPEEFEMVQNFENFNPDEWGYNTLQKFYFRRREGGEDQEHSTSQYMSKAPIEKREEAEEVKMSRLEINQHLAVQERQRVQSLYAQQRRHTHGY